MGRVKKRCLTCGTLISLGSRCPSCDQERRPSAARSVLPKLVKERDGHACQRCGAEDGSVVDGEVVRLHVNHIIPLAAGGTNDTKNMATLCVPCHLEVTEQQRRFYGSQNMTARGPRRR